MDKLTSSDGEPSAQVRVEVEADTTANYASYQNNVPLVRSLTLVNGSEDDLSQLEVLVRCEPAFAEPLTLRFERLAPGESRRIQPVDLKFIHRYLIELSEAERGSVVVEVTSGGLVLAKADRRIDLLAYDQFAGSRSLPELLAAFSLPNNPAVDRLLFQAAELLTNSGSGRAMNGYQSRNREDVWAQISALYSAVAASNVHYSEPPASFGTEGQKIRTPDRIIAGGVATCLDLTMLMTSCLEQAGLNSMALVKKDHAWVGCWLINTTLPASVFDDPQALRKRVASGELLVFETTVLGQRPVPSLRQACELGQAHLRNEQDFLYAIDIKRARIEQILPLAIRGGSDTPETRPATVAEIPGIEPSPALPPLDGEAILLDDNERPDTPAGRLSRWKSKLLDLTLRNRLINFKATRTALQLRVPDPAHLEDALADGQEWKFRPLPPIMQGNDPRVAAVASRRSGEDPLENLARQAAERKELLAAVEGKTMDARLYEIYSAARLGLEEGGANTLYLALGFLKWVEDERAEKTHLAPILLVPVTMTRQSVRAGYSISRHDDETIVNPTLLQLLRQNFQLAFPGLDSLPTDAGGVDVNKIWQIFRLAVKDVPRWEVLEDVYVGIFSFTKYLMWKDLQDRADQLAQNRVVNHLIARPGDALGASEDFGPRDDLDDRHASGTLLAPLIADSSQLNAISRAASGHDFALEGPPGTGKSQTITNLIAHFLGHGKTVLFVAEKMAALDVVRRRLHAIGLGPFCLELHSAKARKTEVLSQLRAAMDAAKPFTEDGWKRHAERLDVLRSDLNQLVRLLHKRSPNGLTVRRATDTAIQYRDWAPAPMPWSDPGTHDEIQLEEMREIMRAAQAVGSELGQLSDHPLGLIQHREWSNAWEESFCSALESLDSAAVQLQEAVSAVGPAFGVMFDAPTMALLDALDHLVEVLLDAPQVPAGFAAQCQDPKVRAGMQILRSHGERRQAHWRALSTGFRADVALADGEQLAHAWNAATATWWPRRWFAQRGVAGRLVMYTVDQKRPAFANIPGHVNELRALNAEDRALKGLEVQAIDWLGMEYKAADTDWAAVARHEQWARRLDKALGLVSAAGATALLSERLANLVGPQRSLLLGSGALSARFMSFRDSWRSVRTQLEGLGQLSGAGATLAGHPESAGLTTRIRSMIAGWRKARRSLRSWCRWQQLREQAANKGLQSVMDRVAGGDIEPRNLCAFAEYSFQTWWLKAITDREPVLRNFSSADHGSKIREFREADERFEKLTERYIAAVLAGKMPQARAGQRPDPELGLVLRELAKQRAHIPVRKLVQRIPTLLPKLKPCLLMSPLSVAQYLDAAHSSFDLIVFDEASQIPVWDAVGAIARGKQLVVVGDPKQLPPTNFFNRVDDTDETTVDTGEDVPIQDLESILDECLGAGLPTLRLEWHYRSRHESLITFSNSHYYESRLITFPSPVTTDSGVKLKIVSGIYDRGGNRTNRAEADAIVSAIVQHFAEPSHRHLTMGVVTFNQTQQRLIETLLDEELRKAPELEQYIAEHGPERLFIKNLENVQGDERDLILFSITYGKDASGRMAMNFGPLNQEGGHRRLNVAITRARHGVTIFSSIRPEDIDVSRTRAAGVADLKHYLEFAQNGPRALVEQAMPTGLEPESPLELEIIRALRAKGWHVHPQVGCSGYRIDMAVVHPQEPGRFILGIECDGATYHSMPTARDRDRLRQLVLEGLGWTLHRIWSTDWWQDPDRELQKLEAALNSRLATEQTRAHSDAM